MFPARAIPLSPAWRAGPVAVATSLAAALIAWIRMDSVARGTLWAEDGRVFLAQAWSDGAVKTVFRSYDGYLHLIPRLLAGLVAEVVPVTHTALAITVVACLIAGATAGAVFVCTGSLTDRMSVRIALAALTVLIPSLPVEVFGNLANVHWFLLWLTPWLLLYRPNTDKGLVGAGILGLLIGLTEIQALYFLPILLWHGRDPRVRPARIGLLVGLAAQSVTMFTSPRRGAVGSVPEPLNVMQGYLADVVLPLWLGTPEDVTAALRSFGWILAIVALIPSGLALLIALRRATGALRVAAIVLPIASLVTWSIPVVLNRMPFDWSRPAPGQPILQMVRYAPVPQMLLASGLVIGAMLVGSATWHRVVTVAAVALLAAAVWWRPSTQLRAEGPVWSEQVRTGQTNCATAGARVVELEIAPEPWVATVPCEVLASEPE